MYHFKFFKGCLPQILLDPILNTLSQMLVQLLTFKEISEQLTFKNNIEESFSMC